MTIYKSVGKFLSTPSARRATRAAGGWLISLREFLSTPSARRATHAADRRAVKVGHFYPRPPRGGRHQQIAVLTQQLEFLSTPSARRATRAGKPGCRLGCISIHALREEGDVSGVMYSQFEHGFLSTPSARRATLVRRRGRSVVSFLSTPSARRATRYPYAKRSAWRYFYPRPPRGGRLRPTLLPASLSCISIHALREEGDFYIAILLCRQ